MLKVFQDNFAFVIGIDNYEDPRLNTLKTPVSDATAIGEVLAQKQHGFEVKSFYNSTALKLRYILEQMQDVGKNEDARIVFYYAGHGVNLDLGEGPQGYFVPSDAKRGEESTFVPMQELIDVVEKIKSRHVLLILDCCFAGSIKWAGAFYRDTVSFEQKISRQYYDIFTQNKARQVLTSTSHRQKALDRYEDQDKNSPFAQTLIDVLSGNHSNISEDGIITLHEIQNYIQEHLRIGEGTSTDNIQKSELIALHSHEEGEFCFFLDFFDPNALTEAQFKNPYKGLDSFDQGDKNIFFGRNEAISDLYAHNLQHALTVVVGASGTGKSSLVKAGLIPRLLNEEHTAKNIPIIRPGRQPMKALDNLSIQSFDYLMIDQWEEVITQAESDAEVRAFNAQLLQWLEEGKKIIGTVRSDFEAQIQRDGLETLWMSGRWVVPSFTSEEYRQIIYLPAKRVGCLFKPAGLVDDIVEEVKQQPGPLPLLSFMMSELFAVAKAENTVYPLIRKEHHDKIKGVSGALSNKANEVYDQLPDELHRSIMRKICLRMVSLSAGELAGRRVFREELDFGEDKKTIVQTVVHHLNEARLIRGGVSNFERGTHQTLESQQRVFIEPAHDALVRAWGRLWEWVKDKNEQNYKNVGLGEDNLLLSNKITAATQDFLLNNRATQFYWKADVRLDQAIQLISHPYSPLNINEETFLKESLSARDKQRIKRRNTTIGVVAGLVLLLSTAVWQYFEASASALISEAISESKNTNKGYVLLKKARQLDVNTHKYAKAINKVFQERRFIWKGNLYNPPFYRDLFIAQNSLYAGDIDTVENLAALVSQDSLFLLNLTNGTVLKQMPKIWHGLTPVGIKVVSPYIIIVDAFNQKMCNVHFINWLTGKKQVKKLYAEPNVFEFGRDCIPMDISDNRKILAVGYLNNLKFIDLDSKQIVKTIQTNHSDAPDIIRCLDFAHTNDDIMVTTLDSIKFFSSTLGNDSRYTLNRGNMSQDGELLSGYYSPNDEYAIFLEKKLGSSSASFFNNNVSAGSILIYKLGNNASLCFKQLKTTKQSYNYASFLDNEIIAATSADDNIYLFDLSCKNGTHESLRLKIELTGHSNDTGFLSLSNDGILHSIGRDGCKSWNLAAYPVETIRLPVDKFGAYSTSGSPNFSPGLKYVAYGEQDIKMFFDSYYGIYEIASNKLICDGVIAQTGVLFKWIDDENLLIANGNELTYWNLNTKENKKTSLPNCIKQIEIDNNIIYFTVLKGEKANQADLTKIIYSIGTDGKLQEILKNPFPIKYFQLSHFNHKIAVVDYKGKIIIYNTTLGNKYYDLKNDNVDKIIFTNNLDKLAYSFKNSGDLIVFDLKKKGKKKINALAGNIRSLKFSKNGNLLISCSGEASQGIALYNTRLGEFVKFEDKGRVTNVGFIEDKRLWYYASQNLDNPNDWQLIFEPLSLDKLLKDISNKKTYPRNQEFSDLKNLNLKN